VAQRNLHSGAGHTRCWAVSISDPRSDHARAMHLIPPQQPSCPVGSQKIQVGQMVVGTHIESPAHDPRSYPAPSASGWNTIPARSQLLTDAHPSRRKHQIRRIRWWVCFCAITRPVTLPGPGDIHRIVGLFPILPGSAWRFQFHPSSINPEFSFTLLLEGGSLYQDGLTAKVKFKIK